MTRHDDETPFDTPFYQTYAVGDYSDRVNCISDLEEQEQIHGLNQQEHK